MEADPLVTRRSGLRKPLLAAASKGNETRWQLDSQVTSEARGWPRILSSRFSHRLPSDVPPHSGWPNFLSSFKVFAGTTLKSRNSASLIHRLLPTLGMVIVSPGLTEALASR